jgi:hypothetical protein
MGKRILWYCTTNSSGFNRFLQDFFRVLQNQGGISANPSARRQKRPVFSKLFLKIV